MKLFLRLLTMLLLLTVALLTVARRQNSGWILFDPTFASLALMSGDGAHILPLESPEACGNMSRWSPDGRWITFVSCIPTATGHIFRMRANGLQIQPLPSQLAPIMDIQVSPTGEQVALAGPTFNIYLIDSDGSDEHLLTNGHYLRQWSPDGQWVYATPRATLYRTMDRIHVQTGVVEPILAADLRATSMISSPDGTRVLLTAVSQHGDELYLMNPDGSDLRRIATILPRISEASWSGEWIALSGGMSPARQHVLRIRPDGSGLQRLTPDMGAISDLQWSPNGEWLLFDAAFPVDSGIYRMRADGSSLEKIGAGSSPRYAPVTGLDWHPLLLMTVAVVMMLASVVSSRVWQRSAS